MIILRLNTRKNNLNIIFMARGCHTRRKIIIIILQMNRFNMMNTFHNKNRYYELHCNNNNEIEHKYHNETKEYFVIILHL